MGFISKCQEFFGFIIFILLSTPKILIETYQKDLKMLQKPFRRSPIFELLIIIITSPSKDSES